MDAKPPVVLDKAEFAEFVHKKADARPCGANHLAQGFLTNLRDHRPRLSIFTEVSPENSPGRMKVLAGTT